MSADKDRLEAVATLYQTHTAAEIAAEVNVSERTIRRDVATIRREGLDVPVLSKDAYLARQVEVMKIQEEIAFLRADAETLPVSEKQILLRAQILDRRIKLLELATPRVTANVNVDADLLTMKFRKAISGLSEDQIDSVYAYAAALPRAPRVTVYDASWFPAPEPALLEGDDEAS